MRPSLQQTAGCMDPKRPGSKQQQQLNVDQYTVHTAKEAHGAPRQAAQCAWLLLARPHVGRFNKKAFKSQLDAIKDKYYEMFRNKSGKETRV